MVNKKSKIIGKLAVPKRSNLKPEDAYGIPIESVSLPYPLQKRVSLAQYAPLVAAQWHWPKNCGWGPEDFSYGSGINVWWKCDAAPDHIWRQRICIRASTGRGCPFCVGQLVTKSNSLKTTNPKLARSWHPTKNTATPSQVTENSNYLAWWICSKDKRHEWQQTINYRTFYRSGCPHCYNERMEGLRDFPEFLKYFDHSKNKDIDPMKLQKGRTVWWRCNKAEDHRWQMAFWIRHVKEACPFCRGVKASSTNNIALNPVLKKEFHPTKNGKLKPQDLPLGSAKEVYWLCRQCGHEWKTAVRERGLDGTRCKPCSLKNRRNSR